MTESLMFKPVLAGVYASLIDKYYLQEPDTTRSLYFGGCVAVGIYSSEYLSPMVNLIGNIPSLNVQLYNSKTLAQRITEVGTSTAVTFTLNRYILQNDIYKNEILTRVAIIAVADILSEYTSDYFNGRSLSYLTA